MAGILRRQIRTGNRPALSGISRFEDDLAAVINSVVVERINCQRRCTMAPVLQNVWRRIESAEPWADGPRMLVASVPTRHGVAVARGPNNVEIGQIRNREAGLATAHAVIPSGFLRVDGHAGTAHVSVILHIAVEVVGNLVVHVDVVHLADRESNSMEASTVHVGDVHSGVIGDHKTIGICGIDPDIVSVSAPADFLKILPPIKRLVERAVGNVNFVVASRRYYDSNVITRAANQSPLEIYRFPVFSRVVGPPD